MFVFRYNCCDFGSFPMDNIDYNYLCTVIGNLSGIPIRVFQSEKQVFYYTLVNLPVDPITPYRDEILAIGTHIGYFITPSFHYYGIVNSGTVKIVIGPSIQTKNNDQTLRELAFQCDVPADDTEEFLSGMKSIVPMPLDSIIQILCTMNYVMNEEKLGLSDIRIFDSEQQNLKAKIEEEQTTNNFNSDIEKIQAQQAIHNTLALEQTIVNFVRRGDTVALKDLIDGIPAVRAGILADDQLRQLKNTFIVTATLVSRGAIRGGMDIDDALSLSDAYIQKCELLNNMERITNLLYHMVFDYAGRVEKLRMGKTPAKLVLDVTNYVHHHLSEPVSIEEMAQALYMNRSWMAVKFKQETKMTLTDFILKEKTEEAKRLLRYTDKPITSISAYLGFSSQSHFSHVFKKYTNSLPNEYRKRYNY